MEKDPDMVRVLQERFREDVDRKKLVILEGDVLKDPFPSFDTCIANIPYYVILPLHPSFVAVIAASPTLDSHPQLHKGVPILGPEGVLRQADD